MGWAMSDAVPVYDPTDLSYNGTRMSIENLSNVKPVQVFWGEMSACEHFVQIYEDDSAFMDTLLGFIRGGLLAGDAAVVIATAPHLKLLEERLKSSPMDMDLFRAEDQYIALDAEKTLAKFMVNGWPDDNLFYTTINKILLRAKGASGRKVRAFGEMVALLWAQGHHGATVQLEHQWHDLCRTESFSLFCAYPRAGFKQNATESIAQVCAAHSRVMPA
jgi:hypothetical protein